MAEANEKTWKENLQKAFKMTWNDLVESDESISEYKNDWDMAVLQFMSEPIDFQHRQLFAMMVRHIMVSSNQSMQIRTKDDFNKVLAKEMEYLKKITSCSDEQVRILAMCYVLM